MQQDVDVGIEASIDPAWFEPWGLPANGALYSYVNVWVRITNNSTSVLDELVLTTECPYVIGYCVNNAHNAYLHDLDLAPGVSTDILLQDVHWRYHAEPPTSTYTSDVCVQALSPNDLMDRWLEDNHSCTVASFTNTVGIGEFGDNFLGAVSPDPFTDHLLLRSSNIGPMNVTLLDATHREVLTSQAARSIGPTRIDLPELTEGIYFLRAIDGNGQWTQRLVKAGD